MRKPESVYGVYQMELLDWRFFLSEDGAKMFQQKKDDCFGPLAFSFDGVRERFCNRNIAPGWLFPSSKYSENIYKGSSEIAP